MAQIPEIPRDQHRAQESPTRVLDRVAHQQPLGDLRLTLTGRRAHGERHGTLRSTPGQCPLDELTDGIVLRQPRERRLPPSPADRLGRSPRIEELLNISSPRGENRATASSRLSMTDSRSVAAAGSAWLRTARQLRADRIERGAQIAELVTGQIERDVELAATQPAQAALDDVDRPEHPLRQHHRDDHRDDQRDDDRRAARFTASRISPLMSSVETPTRIPPNRCSPRSSADGTRTAAVRRTPRRAARSAPASRSERSLRALRARCPRATASCGRPRCRPLDDSGVGDVGRYPLPARESNGARRPPGAPSQGSADDSFTTAVARWKIAPSQQLRPPGSPRDQTRASVAICHALMTPRSYHERGDAGYLFGLDEGLYVPY